MTDIDRMISDRIKKKSDFKKAAFVRGEEPSENEGLTDDEIFSTIWGLGNDPPEMNDDMHNYVYAGNALNHRLDRDDSIYVYDVMDDLGLADQALVDKYRKKDTGAFDATSFRDLLKNRPWPEVERAMRAHIGKISDPDLRRR